MMAPYTVLLGYPDFMQESAEFQTYLAFTRADDPQGAVDEVRKETVRTEICDEEDVMHFDVLFICNEHMIDHSGSVT